MKKVNALFLGFFAFILCTCGAEKKDAITVISREEGSGTRTAFAELFGVLDENKVDIITPRAEITNNTAVMMTSVSGDKNAIGFISLGSLNDTVKAVNIDGVEASAENALRGDYKIIRPFFIATKGEISGSARDFINYIMSRDGQAVIENNGCIPISGGGPFKGTRPSGRIVAAGSSSVTPVMEKLKEAYLLLNPNTVIEIQQSDSSTGMNAAIEGICDIAMSSREIQSIETEKGLTGILIAMDGIAVIVNRGNPVNNLSREQVKAIFRGETGAWSGVSP